MAYIVRCTARLATHSAVFSRTHPWLWDHLLLGAALRTQHGRRTWTRRPEDPDWDPDPQLPLARPTLGGRPLWAASFAEFPDSARIIPSRRQDGPDFDAMHPGGLMINKRLSHHLQGSPGVKEGRGFYKTAWEPDADRSVVLSPSITFHALCPDLDAVAALRALTETWMADGVVGARTARGYGKLCAWPAPPTEALWDVTPWHGSAADWIWPAEAAGPRRPLPAEALDDPVWADRILAALHTGTLTWQPLADRVPAFWGPRQWMLTPPPETLWPPVIRAGISPFTGTPQHD